MTRAMQPCCDHYCVDDLGCSMDSGAIQLVSSLGPQCVRGVAQETQRREHVLSVLLLSTLWEGVVAGADRRCNRVHGGRSQLQLRRTPNVECRRRGRMQWCNGGRLAHPEGLPEKRSVRPLAGAFPHVHRPKHAADEQGAHRPLRHVRPSAPAADVTDVELEPLSAQFLHCIGHAIQFEQGLNAACTKEGELLPC
eukprot:5112219-Pyramimonas_sp.AAC.3